ncbi:MAG: proline racemase family protein [Candidatus Promineofilum sp.]|nr:proline racemase family protein [Promineifilum sp.]
MSTNWQPSDNWIRITTLDAHTAGEPLRIITGGLPPIPGDTILAKRRYAREHLDHLRTALMWEPRGHADMYGCIPTEATTPDGTLGVLFLHNEGWSTMCGHGVIGLVKVGIETGLLAADAEVRLDTPAGRVTAYPHLDATGRVTHVSFDNVPSFAYALDQLVDVPGLGRVRYDVAFGGAFYAYVSAAEVGIGLTAADFRQLIDLGTRIKQAVMAAGIPQHPFEPDLSLLYGVIFVGPAHDPANQSREVCVFADGEVDRSPTGTGVSGRAALHYAKGEIGLNEPFVVESILGTTFTGEVVEATTFGPYAAVVPRVTGTAYIVGRNEWLIDPGDPLSGGFLLR